jgi:hypothetical protein
VDNVFWAALGAAIGGGFVALVVEWIRWFIDRPLIRCSVHLGFIHNQLIQDDTRYIFYEAANPHLKPVTLSAFGLLFKRKKWGKFQVMPQHPYAFPYELAGGKSFNQWSAVSELIKTLKNEGRVPSDLKWVYFHSSSGKTYRGKIEKWLIKELEKEYNKE